MKINYLIMKNTRQKGIILPAKGDDIMKNASQTKSNLLEIKSPLTRGITIMVIRGNVSQAEFWRSRHDIRRIYTPEVDGYPRVISNCRSNYHHRFEIINRF